MYVVYNISDTHIQLSFKVFTNTYKCVHTLVQVCKPSTRPVL